MRLLFVQDNTGRLLKQLSAARDDLDALFAQLDTDLAQSKQIFSQVVDGRAAPAVYSAYSSNAALSAPSHISNEASAAQNTGIVLELQVPAYVHVGDPLVVAGPQETEHAARTQQINW